MNILKAIQTSSPNRHAFIQKRKLRKNNKVSILSLCKSNESESQSPQPEGDSRQQELLAKIAMLQTQKVRLTDYLDERSAYLTKFAEEANDEFDEIGENALKGLDEASNRIMENLESRMQAFEETAETNKLEIEKNEKELEEFEDQIQKDRNEGLFFKNLGQKASVDKAKAKEETNKIKQVAEENAGSETRKNIYIALIGLLVIGITDAFLSSSIDWRKVAVLGVILIALISQFIYEQKLSSKTEQTEKKNESDKEM